MTMGELKSKWEQMFRYNNELTKKGVEDLLRFYERFGYYPGTPLIINEDCIVNMGKHELLIHIDFVRTFLQDGEEIIELVLLKTKRAPRDFTIASDISLTAASYAMNMKANRSINRTTLFYLSKGRNNYFLVKKSKRDFVRFERIVDNIVRGIENNIYIPRGDCKGCEFQSQCIKE